MTAFEPAGAVWEPIVWAVALATMVVGNFAAILQNNIKRMLAYSSVAHAGYVMVAVATHTQLGVAAAMFYLASYAFMNIGAFAVVTHIAGRGERHVQVEDMAGLSRRQPATAWLFTIFLLSLIGIPLTGGFFGKFYVFTAAIDSGLLSLAILGLLNSAVAAYYYLRVLVVMHFHEPADGVEEVAAVPVGLQLALWGSAVGTVVLGVFPSVLLRFVGSTSMFWQGH
jgi:NADH-quinone oxidoreductase subunit N